MIGHDHDGGIRTGELQEPSEHQVVHFVDAGHDVLEEFEIGFTDLFRPGWMEGHEVVAGVVNGVPGWRREFRPISRIQVAMAWAVSPWLRYCARRNTRVSVF